MTYYIQRSLIIIFFFIFIQSHHAHAQAWNTDIASLKSYVKTINNKKPVIVYFNKSFFQLSKEWKIISLYSKNTALVYTESPSPSLHGILAWRTLELVDILPVELLDKSNNEAGYIKIFVKTIPKLSTSFIQEKLKPYQASVDLNSNWHKYNFYPITIPVTQLIALAHQPWVISIVEDAPIEIANDVALSMTNVRTVHNPFAIGGTSFTGKGITMSIGDDGNARHVDNEDRLKYQYNPLLSSGHGVHVMTTAAGAGIKDETKRGFAYGADLISVYFSANLAYLDDLVNTHNVTITNNSYGTRLNDCTYLGLYDALSQSIDMMAMAHPYTLHVFSAGNSGSRDCIPAFPRYGNVGGGYQPAKNTLSVGNFGKHINWVHPNSSKGPLKDGRLKPEIGAIGLYVSSGGNNNSYFVQSGTSMSGPNVAGAAAILSEAYQSVYDTLPLSAVLKAVLMNGANDVANPGPDYWYGFGLMDVQQSLSIIQQGNIIVDTIADGEMHTHGITIPSGIKRAKMMIYWHDPAALPSLADPSQNKLINDLHLSVQTPGSTTVLPWVLDPNVPTALAVRGIDTLNNVEQVTINNPEAGTYTLRVNGSSVIDQQQYVLVWHFEEDALSMLYPIGEEAVMNGDTLRIYFKAPTTSNTFTVQWSLDGGSSWTTLKNDLPDSVRHYFHYIPNTITTHLARVRILENGTSRNTVSDNFTISSRNIVELSPMNEQCPGSIKIQWTSVPTASHYIAFMNIGGVMQAIDTVPASQMFYTYKFLDPQRTYWISVAPIINGTLGIRAVAVAKQPNDGACENIELPNSDIALLALASPISGRALTNSSLGSNDTLQVVVENRGRSAMDSFELAYVINDGLPKHQHFNVLIPPGTSDTLAFTDYTEDFSTPNNYSIKVYLNILDDNNANDTIFAIVRQLANEPVDVDVNYIENFESTTQTYYSNFTMGIFGAERWDYDKTIGWGRLQTAINRSISIQGAHSLSMDLKENAIHSPDSQSVNAAILTLNLASYDIVEKEIRADFLYRFSGRPKYLAEQAIWIRGSDTDPWLMVNTLDTTDAGTIKYSGYLSLNDIFSANGQHFSTSTQIKISQKDTSLIAGPDFGNGLTIDSFRVYAVSNDVSLEAITSPMMYGCSFGNNNTVSVAVRNNVLYTLYDVVVKYQFNGGTIVAGIIDSIPAKTTVTYTFSETVDMSTIGKYSLNAWVEGVDDEFAQNDSILNYELYHLESISSYPYYLDFENDEDTLYTSAGSAWTFSTPDLSLIRDAANGSRAVTSNNIILDSVSRTSYLYLPCMDVSSMIRPYLSFSLSYFFETGDTSTPHAVYVEYTEDGYRWLRLGNYESGYNWYNQAQNVWSKKYQDWIGVSHSLPTSATGIRIVLEAYPGSRTTGVAIDDIHIYDFTESIIDRDTQLTIVNDVYAGTLTEFVYDSLIIGAIRASSSIMSTSFHQFNHANVKVSNMNEAILPTNYVIMPQRTSPLDKSITFYLPYNSYDKYLATTCNDCIKSSSIYRLGISNFYSENEETLNDVLEDNQQGQYRFITRDKVRYIPYGNGYRVHIEDDGYGEYWFNSGGYDGNSSLNHQPIVFTAEQINPINTKSTWHSSIDTMVARYYLQTLISGGIYLDIYEHNSLNEHFASYAQIDTPDVIDNQVTYRLKYVLTNGLVHFSLPITLYWDNSNRFSIHPNPVRNDILHLSWNLSELQDLNILIYAADGRQVYKRYHEVKEKKGMLTLDDLNQLSAGVYFLKIQYGSQFVTHKLVIDK